MLGTVNSLITPPELYTARNVGGTMARIIDTHHHIYPPRYVAQNLQRLLDDATILPASAYQNWTPSLALEQMDKAGIEHRDHLDHQPGRVVRRR